jgi:hypothetical protein
MTQQEWIDNQLQYKVVLSNHSYSTVLLGEIASVKYQEEYERLRLLSFILMGVTYDCLNDGDAVIIDDFINNDCCEYTAQVPEVVSQSETIFIIDDNGENIIDDSFETILVE